MSTGENAGRNEEREAGRERGKNYFEFKRDHSPFKHD